MVRKTVNRSRTARRTPRTRRVAPALVTDTPVYGFQSSRPKFEKKNYKPLLKKIIITIAVMLLAIGLVVGVRLAQNLLKATEGGLFGLFSSHKLKGEGDGMVNILLAGNSADDLGHSGGQLTDSIMMVSVNTKSHKASIWSIPRDLWVNIPGHGRSKINAAYVFGEQGKFDESDYFPGGMGLLQQTIQDKFDIKIQYYALVNYSALRSAVNSIGGIDVNIQSNDPRGLYDPTFKKWEGGPLKLPNGVNHLDGDTALKLSRARGDTRGAYGYSESDFARTANQRAILLALKDKVLSGSTLANPFTVTKLSNAVGDNVKSNFSTSEIRRVRKVFGEIDGANITSRSLQDANNNVKLLKSYRSSNGQSALIPAAGLNDFSDIQDFVRAFATPQPDSSI
jgi:LCP family protein required for cell wall assembly